MHFVEYENRFFSVFHFLCFSSAVAFVFFFSFVLSLLLFSTNQNKWISFVIKLNQLSWIRAACNFISIVWPWKLNAHANAILFFSLSTSLLESILYDTFVDDDGGGEKTVTNTFIVSLFCVLLSVAMLNEKCHCKLC